MDEYERSKDIWKEDIFRDIDFDQVMTKSYTPIPHYTPFVKSAYDFGNFASPLTSPKNADNKTPLRKDEQDLFSNFWN